MPAFFNCNIWCACPSRITRSQDFFIAVLLRNNLSKSSDILLNNFAQMWITGLLFLII